MYHFIIILVIFILINLYLNKIDFFSIPKKNKIPYILFKTGPFDKIPTEILQVIQKSANKLNSNYYYFNDKSCEYFIKKYFPCSVFEAYNNLIPTAYKADLWRYCVLYKYGGIYGDLTQELMVNYDVNKNNVDMILVKDRPVCNSKNNIQISFIAVKPNNNFIKYVIDNVTSNILSKEKGTCPLDITGPRAFGRYFCRYFQVNSIELGLNYYYGLDKNTYKIDISLYMKNSDFIHNYHNNDSIFLKNKIDNHIKLLYKNNNSMKNKNKYDYQWKHDIIYKNN